jgi:quinol monooxygenase YgiN
MMFIWIDTLPWPPKHRAKSRSGQALKLLATAILALPLIGVDIVNAKEPQMMVRISEIKVGANHLEQYKAILKEEAEASVRLEAGVIAIFPMYQRGSDTEFRILEIYANREAYDSHLKTPHFQKYKAGTVHMVESLKLIDMEAIDAETMSAMFKKIKTR